MKISAVFVAYNPAIEDLRSNLESLYSQVDHLYIIDNSDVSSVQFWSDPEDKIIYKWLGGNHGIGKAQNIGLEFTIENGSDFTILSDQDTHYPSDYVSAMVAAYHSIAPSEQVAALTPRFYDMHRKVLVPIVQRKGVFRKKIHQTSEIEVVSEAIASGLFIKSQALIHIGMMNEAMFIDWVDFEWCWKAQHLGYKIFSVIGAEIKHSLGNGERSLAGKRYHTHSPLRYYYIIRNGLYLTIHYPHLPISWRMNILSNVFRYAFGYILLGSPKGDTLNYIYKGFVHGLTNKLGKYD